MAELTLFAPQLRRAWSGTLIVSIPVVASLPTFFGFIAQRPGVLPPEPLLHHLPAVDLSVPLFALLYATIVYGLLRLVRRPVVLLRGLQACVILLLLRMLSMWSWTLEPPQDLVDLTDPVTQIFYPDATPFRKDLFFSGHTATLVLLALAMPTLWDRVLVAIAAALVGFAVLVQHVHWTVDVLAAPVFAWLAWRYSAFTLQWSLVRTKAGAGA
jgi:membrane-associated phospholipid phosphatase